MTSVPRRTTLKTAIGGGGLAQQMIEFVQPLLDKSDGSEEQVEKAGQLRDALLEHCNNAPG